MFIKRNRTRPGGKGYQSVLLVQGKRVPTKRRSGRPQAAANGSAPAPVPVGPGYGLLTGLHALAEELGIVRAAEDHAVREVLGVGRFDEDDLYDALNYLAEQQEVIETLMASQAAPGAVFLYDVTSVYFEGEQNELAAFGHHRDGKQDKRQMVVAPLGLTVADAIERLKGVRLVCLDDRELRLWRLAESYPAAPTEVLAVLPRLGAPVLSLAKPVRRRLKKPSQNTAAQ